MRRGYAGCSAYAGAVVNDNAPVNGCPVGKGSVAEEIAKIMGVETQSVENNVSKEKKKGKLIPCLNFLYSQNFL